LYSSILSHAMIIIPRNLRMLLAMLPVKPHTGLNAQSPNTRTLNQANNGHNGFHNGRNGCFGQTSHNHTNNRMQLIKNHRCSLI
jgi:hypothetical protein